LASIAAGLGAETLADALNRLFGAVNWAMRSESRNGQ